MNYQNKFITNDSEKADFISSFSIEKRPILFLYDEDPNEYLADDITFKRIDEKKYLIQPPYSYDKLVKWLYYGNWQAVFPAVFSYEFINSFRTSVEKVKKHLTNHKVDLMIDSFHDNIEWNLFIRI